MHRFYADPAQSDGQLFVLDAEDARHAGKVLRLRPGDEVEVFWNGQRFLSALESLSADRVTLRPLSPLPSTEPSLSVTLFQGLPKSDKMDWIVQKSVELGVSRIVPVASSASMKRRAPASRSGGSELPGRPGSSPVAAASRRFALRSPCPRCPLISASAAGWPFPGRIVL